MFADAIATDTTLDCHDLPVDAFGYSVRDPVCAVADDVLQPLLNRPSYYFQGQELRVDGSLAPVLKVGRRRSGFLVCPEVAQHLLARPRYSSFPLLMVDLVQPFLLPVVVVLMAG